MKKNIIATEAQSHRGVKFLALGIREDNFRSIIKTIQKLLFICNDRIMMQGKQFRYREDNSIKSQTSVPLCLRGKLIAHQGGIGLLLFFITISIFSQATEPVKEEKKEKSNIEIMQENEANVEKDRAAREKEPLTGYDADTNSKKSIKENNEKYSNFWVVGGSVGSPASGNINVGYYFTNFVLRASGMRYSPHWNGIQGDIGYSFWKTSVVAHSVSLVFGDFNVRPFDPQIQKGGQNKFERDGIPGYTNQPQTFTDTLIRAYITNQDPTLGALLDYQYRTRQYANLHQQYVGLTYDLLLGNFFLQLGMGYGRGDYRNPQLLLQMGYLFDFGRTAN